MDGHLPPPQTVNDFYAAAMLGALERIDTTLSELRDRMPAAAPVAEPDPGEPVAVQEPVAARKPYRPRTGKAGR